MPKGHGCPLKSELSLWGHESKHLDGWKLSLLPQKAFGRMLVKQLMANSWLLTWSGKKSQGYSNLFFFVISEKEDLRVKSFKNYFLSQKRKNKEKEKKRYKSFLLGCRRKSSSIRQMWLLFLLVHNHIPPGLSIHSHTPPKWRCFNS